MILDDFIGRQLGHPRGILSGLVARKMNRTNTDINRTTVQLLEINPTDRVLEIGFGGGSALYEMTKLVQNGLLAGIEVSDAMLIRGRRRFGGPISQGKMELKKGGSASIPYEDCFFDRVCAVNCIYFWPNPVADLREILRVMKKEGRLVVAVYDREKFQGKFSFARHGFLLYSDSQLRSLFGEAGFGEIRLEHREIQPVEATFAVASKR